MQYGILIGRFQPLHKAHQSIIDEIICSGRKPIIFIGSSNKSNKKNPFTYEERASMIHAIYGGEVMTLPLPDNVSNYFWVKNLLQTLENINISRDDCQIYYFLKDGDANIESLLPEFKFIYPNHPEVYGAINATDIRTKPDEYKMYLDGRVYKMLRDKMIFEG